MEGQSAVEHHQHHAGNGHHRADVHQLPKLFALPGEQLGQDHRQDGGHGHQNADVGGGGVGRGGVLQEEVEAAAGDADEDEHQLVLPGELHGFGPQGPQGQVCKPHPQGDDLGGGVGRQHDLGQHEAAAPDQDGEQGINMPQGFLFHDSSLLFLSSRWFADPQNARHCRAFCLGLDYLCQSWGRVGVSPFRICWIRPLAVLIWVASGHMTHSSSPPAE